MQAQESTERLSTPLLSEKKPNLFEPSLRPLLVLVLSTSFTGYTLISFMNSFFGLEAQVSFHITPETVGIIFGAFPLASVVFSPFAGLLSFALGKLPMFALGLGILVVSTGFFGFADSVIMFMLSRVMQGIGSALLNVSSLSLLVSNVSNVEDAISIDELSAGLGLILGPPLGGVLFYYFGFRWSFVAAACIPAIALIMFLTAFVRDPKSWVKYDKTSQSTFDSSSMFSAKLLNPVMIVGFLCSMTVLILMGFTGPTTAPHLLRSLNLSAKEVGAFLGLLGLFYSISVAITPSATRKIGRKRTVIIGLVVSGLSFLALGPAPFLAAFVDSRPETFALTCLGFMFLGTGLGLTVIPLVPIMQSSLDLPEDLASSAVSSVFHASYNLGDFLGPLCAGFLTEWMPQNSEVTCIPIEVDRFGCRDGYQWATCLLSILCLSMVPLVVFIFPSDLHAERRSSRYKVLEDPEHSS